MCLYACVWKYACMYDSSGNLLVFLVSKVCKALIFGLCTFYWFFIFLPGNWKTASDSLYSEWCKYFWFLWMCWTIVVEMVCGEQSLFLYDDVFHVQYSGRTSSFNWCIWNIFQWWVECCWTEIEVFWDVMHCQLVNAWQWTHVTSQNTCIFSNTAVRTQMLHILALFTYTQTSEDMHITTSVTSRVCGWSVELDQPTRVRLFSYMAPNQCQFILFHFQKYFESMYLKTWHVSSLYNLILLVSSVEGKEFLDYLSDWLHIKKDSVPLN
jgi:hypothetical protein